MVARRLRIRGDSVRWSQQHRCLQVQFSNLTVVLTDADGKSIALEALQIIVAIA